MKFGSKRVKLLVMLDMVIVHLSSGASISDCEELQHALFDCFVPKPFSFLPVIVSPLENHKYLTIHKRGGREARHYRR